MFPKGPHLCPILESYLDILALSREFSTASPSLITAVIRHQ